MKTTALYVRVSTSDGRQNLDNQLVALREYAARNLFDKVTAYQDTASGASERAGLDRLMADVRGGRIARVLVFALDRLTREGIVKAFDYIHEFTRHGVAFFSITEPHFTTAGGAGDLFIAIAAWVAEQERKHIRARVKAGLDEARRKGVTLGRPRTSVDVLRIKMLYLDGLSLRDIAKTLELSKSTVERASRDWRQKKHAE